MLVRSGILPYAAALGKCLKSYFGRRLFPPLRYSAPSLLQVLMPMRLAQAVRCKQG